MGNTAKKTIFVFMLDGQLIDEIIGLKNVEIKYKINLTTIRSAIKRKSVAAGKFYFSTTKNFKIPMRHVKHNPLFMKRITKITNEIIIDDDYEY